MTSKIIVPSQLSQPEVLVGTPRDNLVEFLRMTEPENLPFDIRYLIPVLRALTSSVLDLQPPIFKEEAPSEVSEPSS